MTKILIAGNSVNTGYGLQYGVNDSRSWPNQFCNKLFKDPEIVNISKSGFNNYNIFTETASELVRNKYDYIIVLWMYAPRFNFNLGLELYSTHTILDDQNINLHNNVTVDGKWLKETRMRLNKFYNEHWMYLDLIKYINILVKLAEDQKIIFVNGKFLWDENYFVYKNFHTPSELTQYQQRLLSVNDRSDDEVKKLYDMIHDQYQQYGGIHADKWLNLYEPIWPMKVDYSIDLHPGYVSQDIFAEFLISKFKNKLELN
jgi:hypothetical protein